mgnify:CR=1 FL=1
MSGRLSLKIIELEGYKFGKWRVLREVDTRNFNRMWLCRCECDVEKVVSQGNLLAAKSRGCMQCRNKEKEICCR